MRLFLLSLFWWSVVSSVVMGEDGGLPPLPVWDAGDLRLLKQGKLKPGQALLTKEGLKLKDEGQPADPKDVLPERDVVEITPVPELPEVNPLPLAEDGATISRRLLEVYFDEDPESGLNDPQGLLSMQERMDIGYAIGEHESESMVPIYVFVFEELQRVPKEFDPKSVFNRYFSESDEARIVVYYYIGAPERTQYFLGGGQSDEVPEWQMRELLSNAAHVAREKSDFFAQLDDFIGQLSIRLFWIEKLMESSLTTIEPIRSKKVEPIGKESLVAAVLRNMIAPKLVHLVVYGVIFAGLVSLYIRWRGRRRYGFPELEVKRRLGAQRGAVCGGVLSYRSQDLPPSEQREQFKETL